MHGDFNSIAQDSEDFALEVLLRTAASGDQMLVDDAKGAAMMLLLDAEKLLKDVTERREKDPNCRVAIEPQDQNRRTYALRMKLKAFFQDEFDDLYNEVKEEEGY